MTRWAWVVIMFLEVLPLGRRCARVQGQPGRAAQTGQPEQGGRAARKEAAAAEDLSPKPLSPVLRGEGLG